MISILLEAYVPSTYDEFLKNYEKNNLLYRNKSFKTGQPRNESIIDNFLNDTKDEDSISQFMTIYKGRIPKGYTPIAYDPFGNLILISNSGQIYFWDHEEELHDNKVYLISNNLRGFLISLK